MKKEQHKKLSLCQGHREQFAGYRRRYGRRWGVTTVPVLQQSQWAPNTVFPQSKRGCYGVLNWHSLKYRTSSQNFTAL
jgi:hypothetical protein